MENDEKKVQAQQMPVLTIESNGSYVTAADAKEQRGMNCRMHTAADVSFLVY